MSLPTCQVRVVVFDSAGGAPVAGAQVQAQLSSYDVGNGYVVPRLVVDTTDIDGEAFLDLWPNQLGSSESFYTVTITAPNGKRLRTTAVVPNQPTADLQDIAELPPYDGKPDAAIYLNTVVQAAEVVAQKAAGVDQKALQVQENTQAAVDAAFVATQKAIAAGQSESNAAESADRATDKAGIATFASDNAQAVARTTTLWATALTWTFTDNGTSIEVQGDTGEHGQATATGYDGPTVKNTGKYEWVQAWGRLRRIGEVTGANKIPLRYETWLSTVDATSQFIAGSELIPGLKQADWSNVKLTAQDVANLAWSLADYAKKSQAPTSGSYAGRTWEVVGDTPANNGAYHWDGTTVVRLQCEGGIRLAFAMSRLSRANSNSWAELSALVKTPIGRRAYTPKSKDAGYHTDPVTGLTVPNWGEFEQTALGWTRTGEDEVAVLRDSLAAKMDTQWIPRGTLDEVSRGEPRYTGDVITMRSATVRNPSATLATTSLPCSITVEFARGECPSAECLEVLDATGTAVPWQWEPALRPYDAADMSTWPDGSIRAGYIWILCTLAAGATANYTIRCNRVPVSTAGAKAVTYTAYSGTVHELRSATTAARFESGQAFCLRRFWDRANANFDLFQGTPGWAEKLRVDGVDYLSSTPANVTVTEYGLVGATAFGYGVVYQEWRVLLTWNGFTGLKVEVRYRLFADGTLRKDSVTINTAEQSYRSWRHSNLLTARADGLTATWDVVRVRKTFDYGPSRFQVFTFSRPWEHNYYQGDGLQPKEAWGFLDNVGPAAQYEIGFNGSTVMYAGGRYPLRYWLQLCTSADADSRWAQTMTPLAAHSTIEKPVSDIADFARMARLLAPQAISALSAPSLNGWWNGVIGLCRLLKDGSAAADQALADYQSWCTKIQGGAIDPAVKSGYYARWTGAAGLEFQGRNTRVLYWLYRMYSAAGDATKTALVASYIHAFADAIVDMEVASGGNGRMNLRGVGTTSLEDCWNARTTAANALAASLSITANATRQATLDRIVAAYSAAEFGISLWGYAPWNNYEYANWYSGRAFHYYCYQTFELLAAKKRLPSIALPANDIVATISNGMRAGGLVDEWRYNGVQTRRGAVSTNLYAAACAFLAPNPDAGLAHEALRHAQYDIGFVQTIVDGFWNQGWATPQSMLIDVSAAAEVILSAGL